MRKRRSDSKVEGYVYVIRNSKNNKYSVRHSVQSPTIGNVCCSKELVNDAYKYGFNAFSIVATIKMDKNSALERRAVVNYLIDTLESLAPKGYNKVKYASYSTDFDVLKAITKIETEDEFILDRILLSNVRASYSGNEKQNNVQSFNDQLQKMYDRLQTQNNKIETTINEEIAYKMNTIKEIIDPICPGISSNEIKEAILKGITSYVISLLDRR